MLLRELAVLLPALVRTCSGSSHDADSIARQPATYGSVETIELSSDGTNHGVQILDYGQLVEGIPTFEVVSALGDASVLELTYSETRANLDHYHGDGPLPLAGTMDTYRVNRYDVSDAVGDIIKNKRIQGGFRYQKLNLSSAGTVRLRNVGVHPTTDATPVANLAGSFSSSDDVLNRIWAAGARTSQLTQFVAKTIPQFWDSTPDGALISSAAPQSLRGIVTNDYIISFNVNVVAGGFAFLVASDTLNVGIYVSCDFTNAVCRAYRGSTEVDPIIASATLDRVPALGEWHSISATVRQTGVDVSIDDGQILSVTTATAWGSFGIGAAYTHSALFQNLTATSLNGMSIYHSALLPDNPAFIDDFYLGTNPADTLIDGSKRDRIAYIGDVDMNGATAFATTWGDTFVNGSINLLGSFQALPGFWIPSAKISQPPNPTGVVPTNLTGLIGHSFNLVTSMCHYYQMTGDVGFAKSWGPKMVKLFDWAHSQTLPNGLFNLTSPVFGLDWNWYDPGQVGTTTKHNAVYAYSLQEAMPLFKDIGIDTAKYEEHLRGLRQGLNSVLWQNDLGAYAMSDTLTTGFGQDANAIAILAGVPQAANRCAQAILDTMNSSLVVTAGPLAFSEGVLKAGWLRKISPFASGWHLRAAFQEKHADAAMTLLKTLWAPMADPANANYTNTFWETLTDTGRPGLPSESHTSLAHGFSTAPTPELTRNVLGIRAVTPGFAQWRVAPLTLGLQWAKGRHPVRSSSISVDWRFDEQGLLSISVESPLGTEGTILLPEPLLVPESSSRFILNGAPVNGSDFDVKGGSKFVLEQVFLQGREENQGNPRVDRVI